MDNIPAHQSTPYDPDTTTRGLKLWRHVPPFPAGNLELPGFFNDRSLAWPVVLCAVAVGLEVGSAVIARKYGVTASLIALLIVADLVAAVIAHVPVKRLRVLANAVVVAADAEARERAKGLLQAQGWLKRVLELPLLAVAVVKVWLIVAAHGQGDLITLLLAAIPVVALWIHVVWSGYALFGLIAEGWAWVDYRRFLADPDSRARRANQEIVQVIEWDPAHIKPASTLSHDIAIEDRRPLVKARKLLMDYDVQTLALSQPSAGAAEAVARACVRIQLAQYRAAPLHGLPVAKAPGHVAQSSWATARDIPDLLGEHTSRPLS